MSFKRCCCCGKHLDSPYILMKPIGRNKKIPYCDKCASLLLIPALDIARLGVYYNDLAPNLRLVVDEYYAAKGCSTKYFNGLVDELRQEYDLEVDDYFMTFREELELLEEDLIQNG